MRIGSWLLFILLVLIEGTMTSLPLVLIFLLCLMVMKRAEWIFLLALVSGVVLDIFTLRPIGTTSLLLVIFVFMVLLYERKYEIATIPFVAGASLVGSFLFLRILGYLSILESLTSCVLAIVAFILYTWLKKPLTPAHLDYQKV